MSARHKQLHFDRLGASIVDFVSIGKILVIGLDGSQYLEQTEYDEARTKYLESQDYWVIRFWNNSVMNDVNGAIRAVMFALPEQ